MTDAEQPAPSGAARSKGSPLGRVTRRVAGVFAAPVRGDLKAVKRHLAQVDRQTAQLNRQMAEVNRQLTQVVKLLQAGQKDRQAQGALLTRLMPVGEDISRYTKNLEAIRARVTSDVTEEVRQFLSTRQLSLRETLQVIVRDELSFARFGDGEFRLMTHADYRIRFQPNSADLQNALRGVFTTPPGSDSRLMLGWPSLFRDFNGSLVWSLVWPELKTLVPDGVIYGNSHVTRPLAFQFLGEEAVDLWRAVWSGKRVRIITGEASRFELLPELFDGVASADFLYSKAVDAFSDLENVVERVRQAPAVDLHLIALGPAGTLIAARLAAEGYRAIDVGHISDSYLHVWKGGLWPESKPLTRHTA